MKFWNKSENLFRRISRQVLWRHFGSEISDGYFGSYKKNQNGCSQTHFLISKYTKMLLRPGLCSVPSLISWWVSCLTSDSFGLVTYIFGVSGVARILLQGGTRARGARVPKFVVTKSSRSESHLVLVLQNLRAFANSRVHVPQCPISGDVTVWNI